jgi:hypothetical protein
LVSEFQDGIKFQEKFEMQKLYPPLMQLRKEFGNNKKIPTQYEEVILQALSHYPELKNTHIKFELKNNHPTPYGTSPTPASIFKGIAERIYVVSLLEEADPPIRLALFKNLPLEAQRAVIGHELAHVVQYNRKNTLELMAIGLKYTNLFSRRKIERGADIRTIEHGLGDELYIHAVYIRKIPGYVEKRKTIETDYLKPDEILDALPKKSPVV